VALWRRPVHLVLVNVLCPGAFVQKTTSPWYSLLTFKCCYVIIWETINMTYPLGLSEYICVKDTILVYNSYSYTANNVRPGKQRKQSKRERAMDKARDESWKRVRIRLDRTRLERSVDRLS
jgi:hypothetical protein